MLFVPFLISVAATENSPKAERKDSPCKWPSVPPDNLCKGTRVAQSDREGSPRMKSAIADCVERGILKRMNGAIRK